MDKRKEKRVCYAGVRVNNSVVRIDYMIKDLNMDADERACGYK